MKRMTNNWIVRIAALLFVTGFSACHSLEPVGPDENGTLPTGGVSTLTLSIADTPADAGTKVTIRSATGKFAWSKGDRVAVFYATAATVEEDNPAGGEWVTTSEIKAEEKVDVNDPSGKLRCKVAIFPPESAVDGSWNTIRYPDYYEISGKGDEWVPMPMVARNDRNKAGLRFYHTGALMRFNIYAVPAGTEMIRISFYSDKNGTQPINVTGLFNFSYELADSYATTSAAGENGNTVTFYLTGTRESPGAGLSEEQDGLVINVPVPVCTMQGFKIESCGLFA